MPSASPQPPDVWGLRFHKWTHKVCNKSPDKVKRFRRIVFLLLDDILREGDEERELPDRGADEHRRKCIYIYNLFTNYFQRCEVISVRMQPHERERNFTQFIEKQLRPLTSDDLAIFYFHGTAAEVRKDYTWNFRGPGPNKINAYNFINQANHSQADCLFIPDCWVPTRFGRTIWRRQNHMTEIYIAGAPMHTGDGRTIQGDQNYTEALCRTLRSLPTKQDNNPNRKRRVRKTIHELMASDKALASNTLRICTSEPARCPEKGWRKRVWRFVIEPEFVKRDGKLEFYKCEIQDGTADRGLRPHVGNGSGGGGGGGGDDSDDNNARNNLDGGVSDGDNHRNDHGQYRRDAGERNGTRGSKRARSRPPNEESSKRIKKSPSPSTCDSIKREATESPGPEITFEQLSQLMRSSTQDDPIDLMADEDQSLFVSLSNDDD